MDESNNEFTKESVNINEAILDKNEMSGSNGDSALNDTQNSKASPPDSNDKSSSIHTILEQKTQYTHHNESEDSFTKRFRGSLLWSILRLLICIVIIAIGVFVILYIIARAAKYDSISSMLQSMFIELELMWQRVLY